ncbi:MATE family efflux transporter [Brachyspira hyodysenteriae]|uniref:MATE family efflux transporter n=1 Tax=Brachyspira hyodysenteriae TaxID=159 RepID=UPI0022CDAB09|nr:MATE family efflux transporter [Brachyspira hyodysenteriae]MCZ9851882.1 MATE family efflux transporter [Brachyspira hyodysenteriae]MCZ9859380.1 MATE family efflux transporter [Brachyspira hyodysenteriae]MCZ9870604.1 MATE family efflux transporter [Brachyspira hyodysenteriae]MCZ9878666.1 MATE family efflux transporter [Brachyspira hyodysenteriae]MCZ9891393.1 MATE family efflux transporter [Brachyspira hyodysenteriae]
MDMLKTDVKKIFFKYLSASFGSALIAAIYSIVDVAMVGQYEGDNGAAALAVFAPIWNVIYGIGLLFGIGGSVLFSKAKGSGEYDKQNNFFTASFIALSAVIFIVWILSLIFEDNILYFFGADEVLLNLAKRYFLPIKIILPLFAYSQFFAAFLRNDNAPMKATLGVMAGGIFNVFGDYFFVFICDMGIFGAGLATAIGQVITASILISHLFTKKNTLKFQKVNKLFSLSKNIASIGFSTFFIDIAMGILALMFNRQIMKYFGTSALAVYSVIININILVQSSAYAIGQAAQPIISTNLGAGKMERIKSAVKCSIFSALVLSIVYTLFTYFNTDFLMKAFMKPSEEALSISKNIMRAYFISFLILPFNVYATYYFQAIMKPSSSFIIAVLRGLIISGILIFIMPLIFVKDSIWYVMPITEVITFIIAMVFFMKYRTIYSK